MLWYVVTILRKLKDKKIITVLALSSETTNRSLWGTTYINSVFHIFMHYSEKTDNYFFNDFGAQNAD